MSEQGLTIAEVAARTGLTAHALRYYEREGLMLQVGRAGSGHRRYGENDLGWIELITKLRATGMPVRDVRRYAELVRSGAGNEAERMRLLREHRDRVREQLELTTRYLDTIEFKIEYYAQALARCEDPDGELSAPDPAVAAARR